MATLYETDFHAWTEQQAAKARRLAAERDNLDLDLLNIAEELDDMGRSNRQQLGSRLACLYEHLLKLGFSLAPEPRRQWKITADAQRKSIDRLLRKFPSLKHYLEDEAAEGYDVALVVFDEKKLIDLTMNELPETSPFDLHVQVLNSSWLPEPRGAD